MSWLYAVLFTEVQRDIANRAGRLGLEFPPLRGRRTILPGIHHTNYVYTAADMVEAYENGLKGYPCFTRKVWK